MPGPELGYSEKRQKKRLKHTKSPSKADILELLFWWGKRLKLLFKMRVGISGDIIHNVTTKQKLAKLFLLSPLVTNSLDSEKFPKVLKVSVSCSNSQAVCSMRTTGVHFPHCFLLGGFWC